MGFLKIYDKSKTESQKDGYQNYYDYSVIKMDGNYIPAWELISDNLTTSVYIQELNRKYLYNGEIQVKGQIEVTPSYTVSYGNLKKYALKQSYPLTGIHRLIITVNSISYYSDLFMYNIYETEFGQGIGFMIIDSTFIIK